MSSLSDLLVDSSDRPRTAPGPSVVVVGAGLAGLGAAWALRESGCEVEVLERRSWAGGRVAGRWAEGFSVERSIPLLRSSDRELLRWIHALGLSDALLPVRSPQLFQLHRGAMRPIDPTTRRGVAGIPGVGRLAALRTLRLGRLMRRYAPRLDPIRPERAARWDDRSLQDFATLYLGRGAAERWVAPQTLCEYGSDAHELSRVAFLLSWAASESGRARPGVARSALHEVPRVAAERLGVRFACEALRIEPAGSAFRVHLRPAGRPESSLDVDAVVLATPAPEAERLVTGLLQPAERDHLRDVSYAPAFTLSVALERPLSPHSQLVRVPHAEGEPVEAWLAEAGERGGRAPEGCGILTAVGTESFGLSVAGSPDEVAEKALLDSLERTLPALSGLVRFTGVSRQNGAIPHFQVGRYRALERFARVQRDRRAAGRHLYHAGDHLVGPRPQDVLVSGLRAAADLLDDLGRPGPPPA